VLQRTSKGGCPKCRDPHSLKTIVEVIFLFLEKWETTAGHRLQATQRGISPTWNQTFRGPPHVWRAQKFICPLVYGRTKVHRKEKYIKRH
jgi:hypothetical protein